MIRQVAHANQGFDTEIQSDAREQGHADLHSFPKNARAGKALTQTGKFRLVLDRLALLNEAACVCGGRRGVRPMGFRFVIEREIKSGRIR